jgi:hypothetical protein
MASNPLPQPGQLVRVRQRQYLVEEVTPPPGDREATLVSLSCLDDDAQGKPLEVLWEREVDAELLTAERWEAIAARGFDPAPLFGIRGQDDGLGNTGQGEFPP